MTNLTSPEENRDSHYGIERPTIEDIPALLELWREQYEYHHNLDSTYYVPYSEELRNKVSTYLERTIQEADSHILVARAGADLVGFIAFGVGEASYFDTNITRYGELKELLVTESVRGTGVGGELVRTAERHFQDLGLPFAVVQCSSFNTTALSIYERMGYTPRQELLYKPLQNPIKLDS